MCVWKWAVQVNNKEKERILFSTKVSKKMKARESKKSKQIRRHHWFESLNTQKNPIANKQEQKNAKKKMTVACNTVGVFLSTLHQQNSLLSISCEMFSSTLTIGEQRSIAQRGESAHVCDT